MLIKRQPKLSWFINFLAIFLMCLLIANSILGSIYISNLKKRMIDITDNYFLAETKLQSAMEALAQTQVYLLKYDLALKTSADESEFTQIKEQILKEFKKNEINLSSLLFSLKKQEKNDYIERPIKELSLAITQYLLQSENILSTQRQADIQRSLQKLNEDNYFKIKQHLETLTEIIKQRASEIKNSDSLINQYFPSIFIVSFFIALLIGGSYIYVSRQEVRRSLVEQTAQILTEAYQYQLDCLHTLEICKELADSGLDELKNVQLSLSSERAKQEFQVIINQFSHFSEKAQHAFEARKNLHSNEIDKLTTSLTNLKIRGKYK